MRLLDNDLYKFTMQQAILQHYPWAEAQCEQVVVACGRKEREHARRE